MNSPPLSPPGLGLIWPQDGTLVYGDSFNVHAWTDNGTVKVAVECIGTNSMPQTLYGHLERGGDAWVFNVPLQAGTNYFTLRATSAFGPYTTTNFSMIQSDAQWSVTPLSPDQLKYGYATIWGTVADQGATVTVNNVTATNYADGSWEAQNVPLPPGSTVSLLAQAQCTNGQTLETLLVYVREPIVFTQTYGSKLDYSYVFATSGDTVQDVATVHTEVQWARGVGGTNLETEVDALVDPLEGPTQLSSNRTVTV